MTIKRSQTVSNPGQEYRTLRDGKPTPDDAFITLCVGPFLERKVGYCKNDVSALRGVFEPRCVDTIVMPDTAQVIASHVQRGRCKIITGAGHYPYLTHDDAFTPLVLQHMGAAERAPSADDKVSQHAAN